MTSGEGRGCLHSRGNRAFIAVPKERLQKLDALSKAFPNSIQLPVVRLPS